MASLPAPQLSVASQVVIRRSARRRKTVSARREGDMVLVDVPASLKAAEEERVVADVVAKLLAGEKRRRAPVSDDALRQRAQVLIRTYLEPHTGPVLPPTSVRWVTNMTQRWGSCTPSRGEIRLSHQLQLMPSWVVDYVLLHEVTHLVETGHGPRFHQLVGAYDRAERAQGFLDGWQAAQHIGGGGAGQPREWD